MLDQFQLSIPEGATAFIGAPAQPLPTAVVDRIRTAVVAAGVREAHLPQCCIAGVIDPSAQVLVVVVPDRTRGEALARALTLELQGVMASGRTLLVWPLRDDHELMPSIRDAECQIVGAATRRRPWWKFWA